ncbi:MAG: hypothetical protein GXO49_05005, partial [Chlorobi bacterium]|nr:hypothetical protein [Chlorobiota bacterium]
MKFSENTKLLVFIAILFLLIKIEVFAQENITISSIKISGNYKTKDAVIIHELTFKVGDTLTENKLKLKIKESEINLLNTPLFNFINFNYEIDS